MKNIIDSNYFDSNADIMTAENMSALKMEVGILKRTKNWYLRCKTLNSELYNNMTHAHATYAPPQYWTYYNTPIPHTKNESIKDSIATHAPKTKAFLKLYFLLIRTNITTETQIGGNHEGFKRIFESYGFNLDPNFYRILEKKLKWSVRDMYFKDK